MLKINGTETEAAGKTISEYLEIANFHPHRIAVELNGEIIPKAEYDATVLKDGDEMEIVWFMGGGCLKFNEETGDLCEK